MSGTTLITHDHIGINPLNATNRAIQLTYAATPRFMNDLAVVSKHCSMYVKASCSNMPFFSVMEGGKIYPLASWESLLGTKMYQWGKEVKEGDTGCPCSTREGTFVPPSLHPVPYIFFYYPLFASPSPTFSNPLPFSKTLLGTNLPFGGRRSRRGLPDSPATPGKVL